jgi:hypothetical protein
MKALRIGMVGIFTLALISIPAWSQRGEREEKGGGGKVGGGFIPQRGPTPGAKAPAPAPARPAEPNARAPRPAADVAGHPQAPHVHADSQWVGHDSGPNDPHYHLDNPLNTDTSRPASDPVTYGVWRAEAPAVSGSTTSIGAWRRTI